MANNDTTEPTLAVHKFELAFDGPTMLPVGARIVDVGWEPLTEAALDPSANELRLIVWALVDPAETKTEERYLLIAGTGVTIHPQSAGTYLGRIELYEWPRRVQLHVFEAVPAPAVAPSERARIELVALLAEHGIEATSVLLADLDREGYRSTVLDAEGKAQVDRETGLKTQRVRWPESFTDEVFARFERLVAVAHLNGGKS